MFSAVDMGTEELKLERVKTEQTIKELEKNIGTGEEDAIGRLSNKIFFIDKELKSRGESIPTLSNSEGKKLMELK